MLRRAFLWVTALGALGVASVYGKPVLELRRRVLQARELARDTEPYEQLGNAGAVLIVGDSTALGTGARIPAESLAGRIGAQLPGVRIVNRGENGACFADVRRQLQAAPKLPYRFVLVVAGANDVLQLTSPTQLREDLVRLLFEAQQLSRQVVLMALPNIGHAPLLPAPFNRWFERRAKQVAGIVSEVTQQARVPLVNLFFEGMSDPFAREPQRYIAPDRLHPSSEGYARWFKELQANAPQLFAPAPQVKYADYRAARRSLQGAAL